MSFIYIWLNPFDDAVFIVYELSLFTFLSSNTLYFRWRHLHTHMFIAFIWINSYVAYIHMYYEYNCLPYPV